MSIVMARVHWHAFPSMSGSSHGSANSKSLKAHPRKKIANKRKTVKATAKNVNSGQKHKTGKVVDRHRNHLVRLFHLCSLFQFSALITLPSAS